VTRDNSCSIVGLGFWPGSSGFGGDPGSGDCPGSPSGVVGGWVAYKAILDAG
jgi:hypothetical protein